MKIFFVIVLIFICFTSLQCKRNTKKLKEGDKAPEISLSDQNGDIVNLSDFKGKKIALYFYPKDSTLECTQQACSLRDGFNLLNQANITILGLSKGSIASKQKFITRQSLNFPLLIATKKVFKAYGVDHGFLYFFLGTPVRWTFLIDEQGIIVKIIKNVTTKNHAQQILDAFNSLT